MHLIMPSDAQKVIFNESFVQSEEGFQIALLAVLKTQFNLSFSARFSTFPPCVLQFNILCVTSRYPLSYFFFIELMCLRTPPTFQLVAFPWSANGKHSLQITVTCLMDTIHSGRKV